MNPLLFDERVVAVQPSLVRAVGSVTAAAILQQIHYHAQAGHTEGDGWVVRTYADLGAEVGLNEKQVGRAVTKLEAMGVLETCQPEGHLRRKWYRVVHTAPALSETSKPRNRPLETPESALPKDENGGSSSSKNPREQDRPGSFAIHQPLRCERGCWSGWLTDEDGTIHRCECVA